MWFTIAPVTLQKPVLPSFSRKKEKVWLTVFATCPTTQPYFITATVKESWRLVSFVVSLSISPTVGDQNAFIFVISSDIRRPLVAGTFANSLTSHFLRLPTTCKQEMAEKQVQKNTSLGDRVKLIDYAKNAGVGTRRITEIFRCAHTQVQAF